MKDQFNKKAHEESAQLACEAAGSIRTIASLTREDDCLEIYSKSLEEPLERSNKTSIWSNLLYALSQSFFFLVMALVFWYGTLLVSRREATIFEFYIVLMVRAYLELDQSTSDDLYRALFLALFKWAMFSPSFPTCLLHKAPDLRSSDCLIQPRTLMPNPRMGQAFVPRTFGVISDLKTSTSVTQPDPQSACSVTSLLKSNLGHMWHL